ncbi:MAG: hypothetical protein H9872_05170 [Candidatus Cellulosilyticum pullistercoris]|uniref:FMN-binding domain-containing protein n=1 Tax=Candidatus Cellulosilyticum pullistercoris TaxID=2838521 RepID=A0A9E2KCS3_9FIRM|nr:hypothetical protein [Candidatus Cellulosilyticum pullistercoris]
MKKFGILLLTLGLAMSLTACGSKAESETTTETPAVESPQATDVAESTDEAFTGEKVGEVADEKGKTVATVTFEAGQPVDVKFDYINEDGSSKYEQAAAGEYVMGENSTPWNEQVDALAAFLKENNFDVEAVTLTDEDGHTDVVTGVSIKVPALLEAVKSALNA